MDTRKGGRIVKSGVLMEFTVMEFESVTRTLAYTKPTAPEGGICTDAMYVFEVIPEYSERATILPVIAFEMRIL